MFKKLLSFLVLLLLVCSSAWASKSIKGNKTTWDFTSWNPSSPHGEFYNITQYGYIAELDGLTINPDVAWCNTWADGSGSIALNGATIHVPVKQGDKVTFSYKCLQGNLGGYEIKEGNTQLAWFGYTSQSVSSKTFQAQADGEMTINSNDRYSAVTKIELVSSTQNVPDVVRFTQNAIEAELITLNVSEPDMYIGGNTYNKNTAPSYNYGFPSGVNVSFTSSNTKIAKVDASSGDVMMINTGVTTITATVEYNGQRYYTSYDLTVKAGAATSVIDGDEFRLEYVYADGDDNIVPHPDGSGKLLDRVITGIEHITVEFGNVNETNAYSRNQTIVRNEENIGLVATTLDANGWRHLWWNTENGHTVPYQGTFYTFKPTDNGTLVVRGYLSNTNQSASLVDATNGYQRVAAITTSSTMQKITTTVQLKAGHTYYLYGDICDNSGNHTEYANPNNRGQWSVYQLQSFSFSSVFKYAKKSVILTHDDLNNANHYVQNIYAPGANFEADFKGDLTGSCNSQTGEITDISGDGGAIVVKASWNGLSTYYVITVPYISKTWSFNKSEDPNNVDLKINDESNLAMYYKVRRYNDQTKNLEELTKPVISVNQSLDGDNAHFIGSTAGLIIKGDAQSFGCDAEVVNLYAQGTAEQKADVEWVDAQLRTMLNYDYPSADVTGADRLTMNKGVILTIPGLKAGQHVAIEWNHHLVGELGDAFTVTNAKDLDGKPIPENQTLDVGVTRVRDKNGNLHVHGHEQFIVASSDKDFSLHISDNGWVDIYKITISDVDVVIPSGMRFYSTTIGKAFWGVNRTIAYDGTHKDYKWTTTTHHGGSRAVFGLGMEYKIEGQVGTINCNLATDGALSINGGRGLIKVIQRAKTNGYTLDKTENWVPIIIEGLTPHTYPYTWDFQNMFSYIDNQMSTCANGNVFWKKLDNNTYSYQVNAGPDYGNCRLCDTEASQLYANDQVIPDIEGLAFVTNVFSSDRNDKFIQLNKNGLKFCMNGGNGGAGDNYKAIIPNVSASEYVYVRVLGNTGTVKNDINGTVYEPWKTIDGDKVYRFQGNGGDLAIYLGGDVTVKQIGVTDITKTLYDGYATESRDIAIDHSLTNVFTGDNVVAKYVSFNSYDRNSASVTFTDVATTETVNDKATHQVIPANTGVVLYCDGEENTTVPFFVPAMRTASSEISGNMLAANVDGGDLSETMNIDGTNYTPFIFTKTYYKYSQKDGWDPNPSTADQYGYYRLAAKYGTYMSPNKSYLLVPGLDAALWAQSGNVKGVTILNLDDTALSIGNVASPMEPDVFYNMSGSKVTTPTQPGVYIFNGKKVMVK